MSTTSELIAQPAPATHAARPTSLIANFPALPPFPALATRGSALGTRAPHPTGRPLNHTAILQLQQTHGNRHVQRLLHGQPTPTIQRCGGKPCSCSSEEQRTHTIGTDGQATQQLAPIERAGEIRRQHDGGTLTHAVAHHQLELEPAVRRGTVSVVHPEPSGERPSQQARQSQGGEPHIWPDPDVQRAADELPGLSAVGDPLLTVGSSGPSVRGLQEALNAAGTAVPPLVVDGAFGPQTRSAVVGFQEINGLVADGIVGPKTRTALDSASGSSLAGGGKPPLLDGCPPYSQAEREASRLSNGEFDPPTAVGPAVAQQALMWDFEQGKTTTRDKHLAGALKMVIDLGLNTETPIARVALLEGHTDCVDNEGKNGPIRAGRANAARELFKEMGALDANLGVARGATIGEVPGPGNTTKDRARNRSVVITTVDVLPRDDGPTVPSLPNPRKRPCDSSLDPSDRWSLASTGSFSLVGGAGVMISAFEMKNHSSRCAYQCLFKGVAGGVCFGGALSTPSDEELFSTTEVVNPSDFEGDASMFSLSSNIGPIELELAHIKMRHVTTDPEEIDIGGLNLNPESTSIGGGVCGSEGTFSVEKKGIRRAGD